MSFGYRPILLYRSALLQSTSLGKATKFAASQYALMTSLCALPGSLLAGASGFVIVYTGFEDFFIGTSLIGIPVALLAWFIWRNHPPQREGDHF